VLFVFGNSGRLLNPSINLCSVGLFGLVF